MAVSTTQQRIEYEPLYWEPNGHVYCGHALEVLRGMPAECVDIVMTSPPYWGLRTYKTEPIIWGDNHCEHEWGELLPRAGYRANDSNPGALQSVATQNRNTKDSQFCLKCNAWRGELGLEPTIELYIEHLILIFNEVKRVLKKTGTCWVNLDDSYNSAASNQSANLGNAAALAEIGQRTPLNKAVPSKSLCLIPQRFAIAMVENGWILRNDICWSKPNPMPESVKDRFTGSWEHLFFFVKNKKYWFEQQFETYTEPLNRWGGNEVCNTSHKWVETYEQGGDNSGIGPVGKTSMLRAGALTRPNELGRNKRDVWEITTQPYPEAHFAVYPEKLCETPILAGCPSMICKKCGKAREKIYEITQEARPQRADDSKYKVMQNSMSAGQQYQNWRNANPPIDKGYTDCGCNAGFETGVVMDIFAGSGTTGAVSKRLGRKYIGIELSPGYCRLHVKRLQAISLPMELVA